ncbi:unnamed protein product [Durusdinium trenchii]|uniref:Uncharacterized protein n=1 Tax=Durusdinium trenchii TaxID=1381693 RepID=A0ABP0P5W4_9DINO
MPLMIQSSFQYYMYMMLLPIYDIDNSSILAQDQSWTAHWLSQGTPSSQTSASQPLGPCAFNLCRGFCHGMPVPKVVGISGPTRAGKTTLSYGIARKLCDIGSEKHMPRMSRSDRAERFIRMRAGPGAGYCVSVIGQDSFFKPGSADTKWDDPQAIDHQKVLEALEGEIDGPVDLILFEGFKAFHEPRIVEKLDLLLWIDVKEVTSRERRMQANRKVTEEIFAEMWQFHLQYVERTKRLGLFQHPRFRMLEGELPIAEVLQHAIDDLCGFGIVDQRLVESVRSRSRSRGRDSASALLGSTPSQKRCANPSCWFFQSTEKEDGGYCCKKCHWRHVSGSKSGKNHDRVCGRSPAPKETPQAEPTPPSDPYPLEETKEENAVSVDRGLEPDLEGIQENPLFKSQFLCANPSCHFLVSRDLTDGNYCCKKCHWRFVSQSKSAKKRHNSHCAKIYVEGAARAPHRPPKDPYPVEE